MVTPSAAAADSVLLFEGLSNTAFRGAAGTPIEEAVWREAAVVVEARYRQQILMPTPMECRTILAVPEVGYELLREAGLGHERAMDLYSRCITRLRLTPVSTKAINVAGVLFETIQPLSHMQSDGD